MSASSPQVLWFEKVGRCDVAKVGGKNASLGEMVANLGGKGVRVPPGFATTADAYWRYIEANGLKQSITDALGNLAAGKATLAETGCPYRKLDPDVVMVESTEHRPLCVPRTSSVLISRRNRLTSAHHDCAAMFRTDRLGGAIQVEEPA